jgi:hypothetical protein
LKRIFHWTLWTVATLGCGGANDDVGPRSGGQLSLVRLDGLGGVKSAAEPAAGASQQALSTAFDLGEQKVSQSHFFMLQNGGGTDILNVVLKTNDPAFTIAPTSIAALPASGASTVPILRLGVLHGVALDGVGLAPLLSPGQRTATLHIEGQSAGAAVALNADMKVLAKVMDAEISLDGKALDLAHPGQINDSDQFTGEGPYAMIPGPASGTISVKNTGNVVLDVSTKYGAGNHFEPWGTSQLVNPGESVTLPYDPSKLLPQGPFSIRLGGENAIASPERLLQSTTGFVYVAFHYQ